MNNEKFIPDAETRAKSVARLKEIALMFDDLNMTLDEAIAHFEADIRNNPRNRRKREKAQALFDAYKSQ
jgi:hypothetical protein